jgi:hypothetical protein
MAIFSSNDSRAKRFRRCAFCLKSSVTSGYFFILFFTVERFPLLEEPMPHQNNDQPPLVNYFMFHELCNPSVIFQSVGLQHNSYEVLSLHYTRLGSLKPDLIGLGHCFLQQWIKDWKELNRPTFDIDCLSLSVVA